MRCVRQYFTLCWKNILLECKHYMSVPLQIIIPIIMILIVYVIRQFIGVTRTNEIYYSAFTLSHNDIFYDGSQMNVVNPWYLAGCPDVIEVRGIFESIKNRTNGRVQPGSFFKSEKEMVEAWMENKTASKIALVGIVFDMVNNSEGGYDVTYKLRFPAEQHWKSSDKSTWQTDSWYEPEPKMAPRTTYYRGNVVQPGYLREGFLFLQRYIDDAIIIYLSGEKNSIPYYNKTLDPPDATQLKMFPYPNYKSDDFLDVVRQYLPLFIIISFVISSTVIAKEVTLEKEMKLKESMKLMGMKVWINWSAWFTKFFLYVLLSVCIITLLLHVQIPNGAVFSYSDPSVTFFFLILYATSVISFSFMMSAIFSKANVAATTTAIVYLLSYVPYYFMQLYYQNLNLAVKVVLSLFNNLAMAFGCLQFSRAEAIGEGLKWWNIGNKEITQDEMTLDIIMIMLIADIIIYSILTWYFDAIFPGDFGVPQPFYFPFTSWYWTGHDSYHEKELAADYRHVPDSFEKPENRRIGVRTIGLTKIFNAAQKPAVNNVNIDLYEGYITVFLGHNGAGKTTTMFMLTGFLKPSSGTVFINGYDISKHMDKVRRSLGLCPQHNILFDSLTVEQHLQFFANLKDCPEELIRSEVDGMIRMMNLESKRHVQASALSGGMKRKLSIAIALIGGSKFVILDEPTSGMDPESRRQTWEMLQRERIGRTIVLSTHFMDEADLLGDRIAVMSSGVVQCYGSPMFLKDRYGIGYHLTIVKNPNASSENITNVITEHINGAQFDSEMGAELTYLLPKCETNKVSKLFKTIELQKESLGIDSFGASVTTMEEVFIKVAEESDKKDRSSKISNPNFFKATRYIPNSQTRNESSKESQYNSAATGHVPSIDSLVEQNIVKQAHCFQAVPFVKSTTEGYLWKLQGLFLKRVINTVKNIKIIVAQLMLPFVFTFLACIAIQTQPKRTDMPPLLLDYPESNTYMYTTPYYVSNGSSAAWMRCLKTVFPSDKTIRINSLKCNCTNSTLPKSIVEQHLMMIARTNLYQYQKHYLTAIEVLDDFISLRGYFNDESYHAIAVTVNKLSNMRLCRFTQSTTAMKNITHRIKTINHPLPWKTDIRLIGISTINKLLLTAAIFSNSVAFGIGLAIGTFILFLISETASGAKHSQYLAGAGPFSFWSTAVIWDFINYAASALMVVLMVVFFKTETYFENLGYVVLLLIFYLWAMMPLMYCLSHFIKVASNGYIFVTVVNIFTGTVANLVISIMKYPTFKILVHAMRLEWFFYLIFPHFGLNRGLFDLYCNDQSIKICNSLDDELNLTYICKMSIAINESNPCCSNCGDACLFMTNNYLDVSSPGIGRPLIFMAMQGALFFIILALLEYLPMVRPIASSTVTVFRASRAESQKHVSISSSMNSNRTESWYIDSRNSSLNDSAFSPNIPPHHPLEREDDDVFEEKKKTLSMMTKTIQAGQHALVLKDVSKFYNGFLAVDGLSLTIPRGECFGLLGVNGAGKTTTFKMMTGALTTSSGEIYIEGLNVATQRRTAQSLIGYCPQFDALVDQMTVVQTLTFYARLRQIEPKAIPYVVDNLIDVLLLRDHASKEAGNLSGGNKRKLSIGIALIGNPPIIFLDEPTTGMDPVARRKLWNTLKAVRESGKTIVLTTHSMEECEALCTRLAIMVNGRFKCLGTTQHLKTKFGGGYTVIIKLKPNKKKELVKYYSRLVGCFMDKVFPGNVLKDKHEGQLQFQIDVPNVTWAKLFEILEKAKERLEIEDYSVGQTTLEQLFINFARNQLDR